MATMISNRRRTFQALGTLFSIVDVVREDSGFGGVAQALPQAGNFSEQELADHAPVDGLGNVLRVAILLNLPLRPIDGVVDFHLTKHFANAAPLSTITRRAASQV